MTTEAEQSAQEVKEAKERFSGGGDRVSVQVFFKADGHITLSLPAALARKVLDTDESVDLADLVDASGSSWDDVLNMSEWEVDDAFEDGPEEKVPFVPSSPSREEG